MYFINKEQNKNKNYTNTLFENHLKFWKSKSSVPYFDVAKIKYTNIFVLLTYKTPYKNVIRHALEISKGSKNTWPID